MVFNWSVWMGASPTRQKGEGDEYNGNCNCAFDRPITQSDATYPGCSICRPTAPF